MRDAAISRLGEPRYHTRLCQKPKRILILRIAETLATQAQPLPSARGDHSPLMVMSGAPCRIRSSGDR